MDEREGGERKLNARAPLYRPPIISWPSLPLHRFDQGRAEKEFKLRVDVLVKIVY